jgi:hypothetical protein
MTFSMSEYIAVIGTTKAGSCVSGSFVAENCPTTIDQPVRGAAPPEAIPARYRAAVRSGGDGGSGIDGGF